MITQPPHPYLVHGFPNSHYFMSYIQIKFKLSVKNPLRYPTMQSPVWWYVIAAYFPGSLHKICLLLSKERKKDELSIVRFGKMYLPVIHLLILDISRLTFLLTLGSIVIIIDI